MLCIIAGNQDIYTGMTECSKVLVCHICIAQWELHDWHINSYQGEYARGVQAEKVTTGESYALLSPRV